MDGRQKKRKKEQFKLDKTEIRCNLMAHKNLGKCIIISLFHRSWLCLPPK